MKKKIILFLIVFTFIGNIFAIEVFANGANQATITQGDEIVITINFSAGSSQAVTSIAADMNGNEIWEDNIDLIIPDNVDEIIDNSPEDENPANGIYVFTISGDEEGPNQCSNAGLFFLAEDNGGIGYAYLWIDPITSIYSISGSITPVTPSLIIMAMSDQGDMWMTATDNSGNYQNFVAEMDEYMIMAFDPIHVLDGMYATTDYSNILIDSHLTGYDFEFVEGNSTISGHVLDDNGEAVVDASLFAYQESPQSAWGQTDEDGYYEMSVVEGNWEIELNDLDLYPDYMSTDDVGIYIEDGTSETVDFAVYGTDATITGTVYLDDIPVPGYEIVAYHEYIGYTEASSMSNGTYSLSVSSEADILGGYGISVELEDIPGVYVMEFYNNIISGSANINFHIYQVSGGIEGTILDAMTMEPAEDCWINANDGINWFSSGVDDDGSYQIVLPNGTYQVEANGNMYYQQIVDDVVISDEMYTLNFQLDPIQFDGALEGNIYETGTTNPIENVEITVGNANYYASTSSNGSGFYHLDLPNGSYGMDAWCQNYYSYHNDEVIINNDIITLDIELEPVSLDGSLAGNVYEANTNIPIPYAYIQVNSATYNTETQSDIDGYYYMDLPNELYGVDCWKNGFVSMHVNDIEIANNAVIQDFYLDPIIAMDENEIEAIMSLGRNYPNPFNPETNISFTLTSTDNTELIIYNIKGEKIKTLVNRILEMGDHLVIWHGIDESNQAVASGVYFYQLKVGNKIIDSKKMLLLK